MNAQRQIKFKFEFEKFTQLVTHLAQRVKGLDRLKAMKLLYFIDKHHLIRQGRPITGDTYLHLEWGPVPALGYRLLSGIRKDEDYPTSSSGSSDRQVLLEHLKIDDKPRFPIFQAKKDADLDYFSATERESIDAVINELGNLSPVELMDLSHEDATVRMTDRNSSIDFHLFFEKEPDASHDALEKMEMEQDDRDFASGLTSDTYSY